MGSTALAKRAPGAPVDVVEVKGLIDPVLEDTVLDAIDRAERGGSQLVVLQIDSPGSVTSKGSVEGVALRIRTARVPVTIWVGEGKGAQAQPPLGRWLAAADAVGAVSTARVPRGFTPIVAPTLGTFIIGLDGEVLDGNTIDTAAVVTRGHERRLEPTAVVRFSKPGLFPRLLHTVASPSVAYLMFVVGLLLIVFELFTAGVGVAGATGAALFGLSAYGLGVLPARGWAVAVIALAIGAYAVDVQAGAPRFWTAVGTIALVVGSVRLYDGQAVPLFSLAVGVASTALFMVAAMPSMIRTRFGTPTIGRQAMIGELGTADTSLAPDGTVVVRDARWPALTNRATPIAAGDTVRVVGIDGFALEVEPEAGGARDYRDRGH
ncbi:MAG TPA: NfeD family protein [Acidimicrobiales bacterium]|nr:NfeD family protein [Acidimicrobiales bacterium]